MALFEGLELRVRWGLLVGLLLAILLVLFVVEQFTGVAYYGSLQRKVNVLRELNTLAQDGITSRPELCGIYRQTVTELATRRVPLVLFPRFAAVELWKFLSGTLVFGGFAIVAILGKMPVKDRGLFIAVCLAIAALLGWVGLQLPTLFHPAVNVLAFPVMQFLVLWVLTRRSRRAGSSNGRAD